MTGAIVFIIVFFPSILFVLLFIAIIFFIGWLLAIYTKVWKFVLYAAYCILQSFLCGNTSTCKKHFVSEICLRSIQITIYVSSFLCIIECRHIFIYKCVYMSYFRCHQLNFFFISKVEKCKKLWIHYKVVFLIELNEIFAI